MYYTINTLFQTLGSNGVKKNIKRGDSYMSEDEALANSWIYLNTGCKGLSTALAFLAYELALHLNHQQKTIRRSEGLCRHWR